MQKGEESPPAELATWNDEHNMENGHLGSCYLFDYSDVQTVQLLPLTDLVPLCRI